jgi:hypothetical protein
MFTDQESSGCVASRRQVDGLILLPQPEEGRTSSILSVQEQAAHQVVRRVSLGYSGFRLIHFGG